MKRLILMSSMKKYAFLFVCLFTFFGYKAKSTHVIGGEIGYTSLGGNDYEIFVIIYGDCSGSSYSQLSSAIPRVEVYKDGTGYSFLDLQPFGTLGTEVTPVCPSQAANTTCMSPTGTIPGIAKFVFKGAVTLSGPAAKWEFIFNGSFGLGAAGRTGAITNIISATTRMALIATLNNLNGPNNSVLFTTIPTPFYCLNLHQEFNQGAVDPDGDPLAFSLIPGLVADNAGNITGNVTYVSPYSYSNPLAVSSGSFSFNSANGQMAFTPNMIQTSLVVNQVFEIRGGDTVGTTMREMNFVVLNNCNNLPPTSSIPTSNVGTFDSTRTLSICNTDSNLHFVIHASDPDSANIVTVDVTGLPSGAVSSISSNSTSSPTITINWTLPQPMLPGSYTFYVNCVDDGCPLSSHQTFAYTINILQPISSVNFNVTDETCVPGSDGSIIVNATSSNGNLEYSINSSAFQTSNFFSGLSSGNYTITVKDSLGCIRMEDTTISAPALPNLTTNTTPVSCIPGNDGSIIVTANSINGGIVGYSLNGGALQTSGVFANIGTGAYTITATDVKGCITNSVVTIAPPLVPSLDSTKAFNITCHGANDGRIQVTAYPASSNYTYTLLPSIISNSSGNFNQLMPGIYTVIVVNDKLCSDTAFFHLTEPDPLTITNIDIQKATCDKNNASLEVKTNFTTSLVYTLRPATFINTVGAFQNIAPGFYTINVHDSNYCSVDSLIYIGADPNLFASTMVHKDLACNGWGYEGEAEVIPSGGVEPYTYLWSTDPPTIESKISNLYYGWYFVDVIDATGCELKDTVYIAPGSCCENVYLPNAFSPNGDGTNDVWKAVSSTGMLIDQFAVYNRWGKQIWHTNDQRESWNGKDNGSDVEVGTYFYILRYKCLSDQKNYVKKGDIIVIR